VIDPTIQRVLIRQMLQIARKESPFFCLKTRAEKTRDWFLAGVSPENQTLKPFGPPWKEPKTIKWRRLA